MTNKINNKRDEEQINRTAQKAPNINDIKGREYIAKLSNAVNYKQNHRYKDFDISFKKYLLLFALCFNHENKKKLSNYRLKLFQFLDIREIISNLIKFNRYNDVILTKEEQSKFYLLKGKID